MITAQDIENARRERVAAMDTDAEAEKIAALKRLVEQATREWWEERAAIREFDGGQSREDAERDGWLDVGGES